MTTCLVDSILFAGNKGDLSFSSTFAIRSNRCKVEFRDRIKERVDD